MLGGFEFLTGLYGKVYIYCFCLSLHSVVLFQFALIPVELVGFMIGCVFRGWALGWADLLDLLCYCNDMHVYSSHANSLGAILLSLDERDAEQLVEIS